MRAALVAVTAGNSRTAAVLVVVVVMVNAPFIVWRDWVSLPPRLWLGLAVNMLYDGEQQIYHVDDDGNDCGGLH